MLTYVYRMYMLTYVYRMYMLTYVYRMYIHFYGRYHDFVNGYGSHLYNYF